MTDLPILGTSVNDEGTQHLELDRLIGSHACIVANSGGGKSGLIRRLLEITHGQVQHIVLDIEDEFYTLREQFDYVIAGGDGADVPATVEGAADLAIATLTHGFSLVVQLNDLGSDAPTFVGKFLEALIAAPRNLWHPALIVLDEAQRFAPQDGVTAATKGVKALTAQGRKRGFTAILASQRIAKINADVRGDVNNWMLGRVGQSLDRRTMADALGFAPSSAEGRGLQGLPDRTFWAFGPALSREPQLFRVSDVETTPVKAGQAKVATPPPPEALRAILQGLVVVPEPVDDPQEHNVKMSDRQSSEKRVAQEIQAIADLQSQVTDLRGQLDAMEANHAIEHAIGQRQIDDLMNIIGSARQTLSAAFQHEVPTEILKKMEGGGVLGGDDQQTGEIGTPGERQGERTQGGVFTEALSAANPQGVTAGETATDLSAPHQKVVNAIAWWATLGFPVIERRRACVIAGYSPKASTFGVYIASLTKAGLVEVPAPAMLSLTADGLTKAHKIDAGPDEIVRQARTMLSTAAQNVFDKITAAYPNWITRAELADQCGLSRTASTLGVYIAKAGSLGFVDTKPGQVRAAKWLFP
jgi:Helicase HerA, central domain